MDYNQAVITTRYVIEDDSKIVYVYHSEEGWQFFGKEKEVLESDSRITSLDKIILSNPHIEKILWIQEGMEGWINDENDDWHTGIAKYEE